jgi:8-oxo-dGTP diphosphatase
MPPLPPPLDDYAWEQLLARVAAGRGVDFAAPPPALLAALPQLRDHVQRLSDELDDVGERRWLAAALAALAHQVEADSLPDTPGRPAPHEQSTGSDTGVDADAAMAVEVAVAIVIGPRGVLAGRRRDRIPPWVFPGGAIEPGEAPSAAAVRECAEETGLRVHADLELGRRRHPVTGRAIAYIACHLDDPDATPTMIAPYELDELRWLDAAEIDHRMPELFTPVREHLNHALPLT